jgi:hypothetical protein
MRSIQLVCAFLFLQSCGPSPLTSDASDDHPGAGGQGDGPPKGTGGATASDGQLGASGGSLGADGSGGKVGTADGGLTCAEIAGQYGNVLDAQQRCVPGAANQCQQIVPAELAYCSIGCMTPVNDSTALNNLQDQWEQAGCRIMPARGCGDFICGKPSLGMCLPGTSGATKCAGLPPLQ